MHTLGRLGSRRSLLALPVPILALTVWQISVEQGGLSNLPSPTQIGAELGRLISGQPIFDADRGQHILASLGRVAAGFGIACLIAIPLGVFMGRSRLLASMLDPILNVLRPIPVTAWAPLMVVVIGIGTKSTIMLITIAAFYPVLLNTLAGVRAVPPRLLEAAAMLGTKPHNTLWRVVLPAAVPNVFAGMRIALGLSWAVLVVGETVGVPTGLGSLIMQAWQVSRTDVLIAGMAVIGLAGFLSDLALVALFKVVLRKRPLLVT